jgi:membrane protease subunit (stomatin/prohibitin family)
MRQGEEGLLQQALTNIEEDVAKGIPRHSSVICHSPIYSIEADERCISVFMENGYYWSSAQVIPALVLLKRYVFDSIDRTIIRKYKMPTDDKRYPFDRFDH